MTERLTIDILAAGAAFDAAPAAELARILRIIALRLDRDDVPPTRLYDLNGNHCGVCTITPRARGKAKG